MSDLATRERPRLSIEDADAILCMACRHAITAESFRTEREGSSEHTRTNPAGFEYRIGCFASAPGARIIGEYTLEFSWFDGYAWCFLICSGCSQHLGWHFSGNNTRDFHALILNRLEGPR